MGRTELQDAVPMTVGQEMHAFAATLEDEAARLRRAETALYAINMGGTAIGTGLNAPRGFAKNTAKHLAKLTKKPFVFRERAVDWDAEVTGVAPRIGINRAEELEWRFCEVGSRYLSRPIPAGA